MPSAVGRQVPGRSNEPQLTLARQIARVAIGALLRALCSRGKSFQFIRYTAPLESMNRQQNTNHLRFTLSTTLLLH